MWLQCEVKWLHCCSVVFVTKASPTLCIPVDCSLPGSSVLGMLRARILEWVVIYIVLILLVAIFIALCCSLVRCVREAQIESGSASVFRISSLSIYWALHIYMKDFIVQERYISIFYSVLVWWILSSRTHQNNLIPSWLYCGFFECLIMRIVTITIIINTTLKVYRTESWFRLYNCFGKRIWIEQLLQEYVRLYNIL